MISDSTESSSISWFSLQKTLSTPLEPIEKSEKRSLLQFIQAQLPKIKGFPGIYPPSHFPNKVSKKDSVQFLLSIKPMVRKEFDGTPKPEIVNPNKNIKRSTSATHLTECNQAIRLTTGDKVFWFEWQLEKKICKRESRIKELKQLEFPKREKAIRNIYTLIQNRKKYFFNDPNNIFPALYTCVKKIQVDGIKREYNICQVEVHSKKLFYVHFIGIRNKMTNLGEGVFKKVTKAWRFPKPKLVAYAFSNLKGDLMKLGYSKSEEYLLSIFQGKNEFVKLLHSFYYSRFQQVMIMKYYPTDLLDVINHLMSKNEFDNFCLPDRIKLNIMRSIFRGLAFLHSRGIIHRDVKSDNILMTKNYKAKLCDFGFTCFQNSSWAQAKMGTLFYSPYEFLVEHKMPYSTKLDVWSAACVCWLLFSEKKYAWFDYLDTDAFNKRKAIEAIKIYHKQKPDPSQTIPYLFWRMFDPNPDTRISSSEVLRNITVIQSELPNHETFDFVSFFK